MLPKIIVTDIDGVWTDGGMYYDETGNEWKKFNTADSAGVLWCRLNNIPIMIITGENTEIVKRRADKLRIDHVYLGVKNKVEILDEFLTKNNIAWSEVGYIGDDINDYHALQKAGYSACPLNASEYIKDIVDVVVPVKGGDGAFRFFIEDLLNKNGIWRATLEKYLEASRNKFSQ